MARVRLQMNDKPVDRSVAEAFAGLTAAAGARKGFKVERPDASTLVLVHRYTPGWAILLGILGLFVFLLGLLFFLVKTEDRLTVIGHDTGEGMARFTVTGFTDRLTADVVEDFLRPSEASVEGTPVVV